MEAWIASGRPVEDRIKVVNAVQAHRAVLKGVTVLDVREPGEFQSGHIEGAMNVPLGKLEANLDRIPKGQHVLAYCGHGERSSTAASLLERAGIGSLLNLSGGIGAWMDAGYMTVSA